MHSRILTGTLTKMIKKSSKNTKFPHPFASFSTGLRCILMNHPQPRFSALFPRFLLRRFLRLPKSAPNRIVSHAAQHANARNRCWGPLKVVRKLRTTRRHGFRRHLARFRTQNFAAAKHFRKFRSDPPRIARNLTRHSMLTVATDVGDLQGS